MNKVKQTLDYVTRLIARYEQGRSTPVEKEALDTWLPSRKLIEQSMPDAEDLAQLNIRIWNRLVKQCHLSQPAEHRFRLLSLSSPLRQMAAAAVVLLAMGGGVWMAWNGLHGERPTGSLTAEAPRRVWTTDERNRQTLTLPDGSKIQLNAGSRLEIVPSAFDSRLREVWLTGEAFFQVAKDPQRPFVIHAGEVKTVVKGTSFNIKAYGELRETVVSVRDGQVEVSATGLKEGTTLLTANQQLRYDTDKLTAELTQTDWRDAAGWTEGRFTLNGAGVEELRLRLLQQFGVKLNIHGQALQGRRLAGSFRREATLDEVLTTLCTVYGTSYKRDGDQVTIHESFQNNHNQ